MRHLLLAVALVALFVSSAFSQIQVQTVAEEWVPFPVSLNTEVPEGADAKGPGWIWPEEFNKIEVGPNSFIVCAKPGTYVVQYKMHWLHIVPVTFTDGAGKEITIMSYLGHGDFDEQATITIKPDQDDGDDDDDDGDDDDGTEVAGPYRIMLFFDKDQLHDLTKEQAAVLNGLSLRKKLEAKGHVIVEVLEAGALQTSVPIEFKPFVDSILGDPLPRVAFLNKDGTKVLDMALPSSPEDMEYAVNNLPKATGWEMVK